MKTMPLLFNIYRIHILPAGFAILNIHIDKLRLFSVSVQDEIDYYAASIEAAYSALDNAEKKGTEIRQNIAKTSESLLANGIHEDVIEFSFDPEKAVLMRLWKFTCQVEERIAADGRAQEELESRKIWAQREIQEAMKWLRSSERIWNVETGAMGRDDEDRWMALLLLLSLHLPRGDEEYKELEERAGAIKYLYSRHAIKGETESATKDSLSAEDEPCMDYGLYFDNAMIPTPDAAFTSTPTNEPLVVAPPTPPAYPSLPTLTLFNAEPTNAFSSDHLWNRPNASLMNAFKESGADAFLTELLFYAYDRLRRGTSGIDYLEKQFPCIEQVKGRGS